MSRLQTVWRYTKGLLAGFGVLAGTVGIILLVELSDAIPDPLSWLILVGGLVSVGYAIWKASRPRSQGSPETQPEVNV